MFRLVSILLLSISVILLTMPSAARGNVSNDFGFSGGCGIPTSTLVQSAEGGCRETKTGIVWSRRGPNLPYEDALTHCQKFKNGRWAQWSLPKLEDFQRVAQMNLDTTALGIKSVNGGASEFFWAKSYDDDNEYKQIACLVSQDSGEQLATKPAAVVCIRQGAAAGTACRINDAYFTTADGGCMYRKTQRVYSIIHSKYLTYTDANTHCRVLKQNGYEDWRLPTDQDLLDIGWEGGADFHLPSEPPDEIFWTGSTEAPPPKAWLDWITAGYATVSEGKRLPDSVPTAVYSVPTRMGIPVITTTENAFMVNLRKGLRYSLRVYSETVQKEGTKRWVSPHVGIERNQSKYPTICVRNTPPKEDSVPK